MYRLDILVQGFPGKAICHGGLGWSTIALLRSADRKILIDDQVANGLHKTLPGRPYALFADYNTQVRYPANHVSIL